MDQEIVKELRLLREEIEILKKETIPRLERLEAHIDFIEHTYDELSKPLNYVKSYFNKPSIQN